MKDRYYFGIKNHKLLLLCTTEQITGVIEISEKTFDLVCDVIEKITDKRNIDKIKSMLTVLAECDLSNETINEYFLRTKIYISLSENYIYKKITPSTYRKARIEYLTSNDQYTVEILETIILPFMKKGVMLYQKY